MLINTNFDQRVAVHANPLKWVATRMTGVERHMLDRIGAESGHATSIVRYARGSKFSAHTHTGGEEFFVLDGVFQDEHGEYPVGTYVRNPPTSSHTPRSDGGCTIFVKLWQFDDDDRTQIVVDTNNKKFEQHPYNTGIKTIALFQDNRENVRIEIWQVDQAISLFAPDGMEILVLEGSFEEGGEIFNKNEWLRLPKGYKTVVKVGDTAVRLWVKAGNLADTPAT